MFSVIAQMWTWASVSPGISVAPLQSSVVTGPGSAPTVPWRATSLMVSSSTTTAAPSTGSGPGQSVTHALVKTRMVIGVVVLDLVQVRPPLVDDVVRLDLESLELGGDGERDVVVRGVAAGRRVERQLKLRGIGARLLEQRLGPRRVVLVAVDRRVVDVGRPQRAAHPRRAAL